MANCKDKPTTVGNIALVGPDSQRGASEQPVEVAMDPSKPIMALAAEARTFPFSCIGGSNCSEDTGEYSSKSLRRSLAEE